MAGVLPLHQPAVAPRWVARSAVDRAPSSRLIEACHGNLPLAAILQARGISEADAAALLLDRPGVLADPFLLPGMDRAVACLRTAARQRQCCAIVGDFDCDGLAGTALLAEGLAALGLQVRTLLPQRLREGYGLAAQHVEQLAAEGISLLLTVDCGSTAQAALERAAQLGVTVLVTDHHPLQGVPPPCTALLNPRRADSHYPHRDLCGAGVAQLLLRALVQKEAALDPEAGLDLVALATVADLVPLCGENRALVRRGLERMARAARPGLRALMEVSGTSRPALSARDVAFELAPRLNAAGRLGPADPALALLRARRLHEARTLAAELDGLNRRRRALTRAATAEANARIEVMGGPGPLIVTWAAGWHAGVVGLVAARLVECYGRPAIALGWLEGRWRGSARSVVGFDVAGALARCGDLLLRCGGHAMAAGLEAADEGCLTTLRRRLQALAAETLDPGEWPRPLAIDLHLPAEAVDWRLAEAACALQPCGAGWPEPVVAVHGAAVLAVSAEEGMLRLRIAVADGMALTARLRPGQLPPGVVRPDAVLDLAATPVVRDRWGYRCLELEVLDARQAGTLVQRPLPQLLLRV